MCAQMTLVTDANLLLLLWCKMGSDLWCAGDVPRKSQTATEGRAIRAWPAAASTPDKTLHVCEHVQGSFRD